MNETLEIYYEIMIYHFPFFSNPGHPPLINLNEQFESNLAHHEANMKWMNKWKMITLSTNLIISQQHIKRPHLKNLLR